MHSFGIAIDIRFNNEYGKYIYWYWASSTEGRYWGIPLEKRYLISKKIVDVFEKYGFIWGGKWINFDSMHFEYRPELIID